MDQYRQIFENNRKWVEDRRRDDPEFFKKLADGQEPDFLYIGCADSRIVANEVMGLRPGEVFVHRNIANLVVNTDLNVHSVIEYAVSHLRVKHIIVCGHYGCGGIKAAMTPNDHGLLNGWLREVRDVYRLHRAELELIDDEAARYARLVELNVQEQCIRVLKTAAVQNSFAETGYPNVHGWVYDLADGHLLDLEIPFQEILDDIRKMYRLPD